MNVRVLGDSCNFVIITLMDLYDIVGWGLFYNFNQS